MTESFDFGEYNIQRVVLVVGLNGSNERDFVLGTASGLATENYWGVFQGREDVNKLFG